MRRLLAAFVRRYRTALGRHLKAGGGPSSNAAVKVGQRVIALGLGSSELSRIHERALSSAKWFGSVAIRNRRVEVFVAAVNKGRREARRSYRRHTMRLRAVEKLSHHQLSKRNENRRENAGGKAEKLLKASLKAQETMRRLTRRNITAQEHERHLISRRLQDVIAQTLLGVHVRLVNLRTTAHGNKTSLTKEIARTQRMVKESVRSINRFARELSAVQPA